MMKKTTTRVTARKKSAAKPPARYIEAIGRRKTAVARVRIIPASQTGWTINGRSLETYFPTPAVQQLVLRPLQVLPSRPNFKVTVKVSGGGAVSQAGAIALGFARALVKQYSGSQPLFKKHKLLTRDARFKERRKFGLKKARKAPQWSKR